MTNKVKAENTLLLYGGEVPRKFYDKLLRQSLANSKYTQMGLNYISEQILGKDFWINDLFIQDRQMAGLCIKDMVKRGLIPYIFVEKRSDNKSTYERI